jgi:predicted cobalt transporter CbtA
MKNREIDAIVLIITIMMFASMIGVFHAKGASIPWQGYVKPAFPDYAPSGVPDFDEKQDGWGPSPGWYTWSGPVAAANSLWWVDSEYESLVFANPVAPPTVSDHFPLVTTYNASWDDHDPRNVDPLVRNLASLMDTDGVNSGGDHVGTRWTDLATGISAYIAQQGLSKYFEVYPFEFPSFSQLSDQILNGQEVVLLLEFYQLSGNNWYPVTNNENLTAGNYVTCAGVNATTSMVLISDPYQDAYEAGTAPGRSPVPDTAGYTAAAHNNATYVSQDAYNVTQYAFPINSVPPFVPPYLAPPGYPPIVWELQGYLQTMGYDASYHAFIRVAVVTSPIVSPGWSGYVKPGFTDYAPSGMPDFDENQNAFTTQPGQYTWCAPVAVANSLWWLDSEYESIEFANPVPPPTISDHFNLVNSSNPGVWDDHDPQNVIGLVTNLAVLMDTDGLTSHDGHMGTRITDIQSGIQEYLQQQGVANLFEVYNSSFPTFTWIDNQTELYNSVELCLEFWQLTRTGWIQPTFSEASLNHGHCVACAGSNSTTSQVLISDPYQDAYEAGTAPGRSPMPHAIPHNSAVHNDAQYVSQDAYNVSLFNFSQSTVGSPPGYPSSAYELQGYLQSIPGTDSSYHAFIRLAVATSPVGVHDVAVTNISTCKDGCSLRTVGQGCTVHVNVGVANLGNFNETFNVTAYANNTEIGWQTFSNLAAGGQALASFLWNTSEYAIANYTLSAHADTVTGETNTSNNDCADGIMSVTIPGDVDGNGRVNMGDVVSILLAFGSTIGQSKYVPNCDIDDNHRITMGDVIIALLHFGQHYP